MAGLDFLCDWRYAMNLSGRQMARAGYLLTWSGVGGLNLTADITVQNPFTSTGAVVLTGTSVKCVGVIEKFGFAGDKEDPIRMVAYVSAGNAAALGAKLASGVTSTKFTFSFAICGYDGDAKTWFEAGYVQGGAKASSAVDTMDGKLQLFIDASPVRIAENVNIALCRMEFQGAASTKTASTLQFATGAGEKVTKTWGGA